MTDHRNEIECPRCRQINARYTGWRFVFNPKFPEMCSLCGADLRTGERDAIGVGYGAFFVVLIYGLHALAGAGVLLLVSSIFLIGRLDSEELARISFLPPVVGALAGIALADWSRRRGTLVSNRREPR